MSASTNLVSSGCRAATGSSRFTSANVTILRASPWPRTNTAPPRALHSGDPDERAALLRYLQHIQSDTRLREALALASPDLSRAVEKAIAGGAPRRLSRLRRLVRGLAAYESRAANRATPFGLLAGVAIATFGAVPVARLGPHHQRYASPDAGSLARFVEKLHAYPDVLAHLSVWCHPLVVASHTALTYLRIRDDEGRQTKVEEVRIRLPAALSRVVAATRRPTPAPRLADRLAAAGRIGGDQALEIVRRLVESGVLTTNLRPPVGEPDEIRHLSARLPAGHPGTAEVARLAAVVAAVAQAGEDSAGTGIADVPDRVARLADMSPAVKVDLALDATVVLPLVVRDEAERAADVVWRLSPPIPRPPRLAAFHQRFLDRYGTDCTVPLLDAVDDRIGVGLLDYLKGLPTEAGVPDPADFRTAKRRRRRILDELAARARDEGCREVVLDDATVEALAMGDACDPVQSCDLYAQLVARDTDALGKGDFRLVGPRFGVGPAGSALVRFRLGSQSLQGWATLAGFARAAYPDGPVDFAEVACRPSGRAGNVFATPGWLAHHIPLDPTKPGGPEPIPVDDVALTATPERLILVRPSLGRAIVPMCYSSIRPEILPPLACFLVDLGGQSVLRPRWWAVDHMPTSGFQPRLRYGRTVLRPAMWSLSQRLHDAAPDPAVDPHTWGQLVGRWRSRLAVPARVVVEHLDRWLALDLSEPWGQQILRRECVRHEIEIVAELPNGEDTEDAWLTGRCGPHASELVFPMARRQGTANGADSDADSARPIAFPGVLRLPGALAAAKRPIHLPGGAWLSAHLIAPERAHDEILAALPPALDDAIATAGVDRWFAVRYRTRDCQPHLRLRFHGEPGRLNADLLPALGSWTRELLDMRLASRLALESYEPEVERYGGPDLIEAAERVFWADTVAVIGVLIAQRENPRSEPSRLAIAAAGVIDITRAFDPSGESWRWLADRPRDAVAAHRSAVTVVSEAADWLSSHGNPELSRAVDNRRVRAAEYGSRSRFSWPQAPQPQIVQRTTRSIAHMHCNRLLGIDPALERAVLRLAADALAVSLAEPPAAGWQGRSWDHR